MHLEHCQCGHDHDGDDVEGEDDVDRGGPVAKGQEHLHKNSNKTFLLQEPPALAQQRRAAPDQMSLVKSLCLQSLSLQLTPSN